MVNHITKEEKGRISWTSKYKISVQLVKKMSGK
jgi:hypothetical protein